ncbi:molybdopterin converting factor subunit 1 [Gammaproteobacteria bacterium 42_54_T18]|nr:molybdopterin converting factor subunit 1 [Gammaproteobacteria bacterium 42_54_T18]
MIDILYFASIKERMGISGEPVAIEGNITGEGLINLLSDKGEPWQTVLSDNKLLIAINQEMASLEDSIAEGDEVAFFPPVTGG